MPRKPDPIPPFLTEADERAYWETHDSTPHIDWATAKRARSSNGTPSAGKLTASLS